MFDTVCDISVDSHSAATPVASPSLIRRDAPTEQPRPGIIRSGELLHGARELWIEHGQDMYRLRVTASGKLYLTK